MKEVIIVGGGYSIKEGIEKDLWKNIENKNVWSLNFAYKFMPFIPSKQLWADTSVWEKCKDDLLDLHSRGAQLVCRNYGGYEEYPFIKRYDVSSFDYKGLLTENELFIGRMGLVGVFAMSLAAKLGYDVIYLLGYDFGAPDTKNRNTHFYQEDDPNINAGAYGRSGMYWEGLYKIRKEVSDFKKFADDSDYKVYNVSLNSNIPYFEKVSYEDFFSLLRLSK
jgi:hypothetical protein